jgi:catechol 2,3-dioxygenase-like lactoylglutathione lyase family enzyme
MMISPVTVGLPDLKRAAAFYDAMLAPLGIVRFGTDEDEGWIGWQKSGERFPTFWICRPFDGAAPHPGNGTMTAFIAPTRAALHAAYDAALARGGTSEGAPGLRRYAADWYGAYVRDPDGNKLCVVHRGG